MLASQEGLCSLVRLDGLLGPRPTSKMGGHPLLAVRDWNPVSFDAIVILLCSRICDNINTVCIDETSFLAV